MPPAPHTPAGGHSQAATPRSPQSRFATQKKRFGELFNFLKAFFILTNPFSLVLFASFQDLGHLS